MQPVVPQTMLMPGRTIVGSGKAAGILRECAGFGPRGILVHGASLRKSGALCSMLAQCPAGAEATPFETSGGEPTLAQAADLIAFARDRAPAWIAAVGGGSVMDLAKTAAGLVSSPHPVQFHHDGGPIVSSALPVIAAPTTAGTGSEVTPNAVLTNTDTGTKKSIRHDSWVPRLVILDANLMASSPRAVVAHAGMDALTQAIEAFISRNACWFSDELALKAVQLIHANLVSAVSDPSGPAADSVLLGSYLAGLALAHARLGVVHGIVHPLGAIYKLPHGLLCAVALPHALELNRAAAGDKYNTLATALGSDPVQTCAALLRQLGLSSPLAGRTIMMKDKIVSETLASGSTAANPRKITNIDVEFLLDRLFEDSAR